MKMKLYHATQVFIESVVSLLYEYQRPYICTGRSARGVVENESFVVGVAAV